MTTMGGGLAAGFCYVTGLCSLAGLLGPLGLGRFVDLPALTGKEAIKVVTERAIQQLASATEKFDEMQNTIEDNKVDG